MLFTLPILIVCDEQQNEGRGGGGMGVSVLKRNYNQIFHSFWRTLGSNGNVWSKQSETPTK